jgi:hypothetical protein
VSHALVDDNTLCDGFIIESSPRSQHRPVLLHYGIRVSIEKPRWNFSSVDWESVAADIDHVVRFIPACSDSYERFLNVIRAAAKRQDCENLFQEYNTNNDRTTTGRVKRSKKTKVGKNGRKHEFHPF